MNKTAETITTLFAVLCIAVGIVALAARSPLATVLPGLRGTTPMIVLSGSMEPRLPVGGIVFVQKADTARVKVGDIIAFLRKRGAGQTSDDLTTHRVVSIEYTAHGPVFTTKGDANRSADVDPVPAQAVVGIAGPTVPYLGYLAAFSRSPIGFCLLIVLPALVIAVGEAMAIRDELRRQRRAATRPAGHRFLPDEPAEQSL
jgi:signal peptidase